MPMTHALGYETALQKVVIKKIHSGEELCIVGCGTNWVIDITIEESLMSTSVVGNMVVKESNDFMDKFGITGHDEIVYIEIENFTIPGSDHKLEFCINDIHKLGDASTSDGRGSDKKIKWKIHFVSCEPMYLDIPDWQEKAGFVDEDRFLKIAKGRSQTTSGGSFSRLEDRPEEGEEDLKDLVGELADKYFNPGATNYSRAQNEMEIEGTHNGIWLKSYPNLYPWGKSTNTMSLMQTMTNLAENSITHDMKHSNFFFWADWNGYHFKSVNQMIEDTNIPKSSEGAPDLTTPHVYQKSDGVTQLKYLMGKGDPKILYQMESQGYDHIGHWQDGAYSSYYERTEPNYSDPYVDYLDSGSKYPSKIIDYDYHRDWEEWNTIEEYKIISDEIDTSLDKENPQKNRLYRHDNDIYGYFSPYLNDQNPKPYDFIVSRLEQGNRGKTNNIYWQSQGDICNYSIADLEKIHKKIIKPSEENYKEFLRIKNLKEKWNIYRHTVCCDKQDTKTQFFAVIDDAKLISDDAGVDNRGGIYEYTWREVELWPTDAINDLCENENDELEILTNEDAPISAVAVPGGLKGTAMETDGAYNINELMNMKIDDDVFVGPGINVADDDFNDYPEAYQMMPIGGYFKVGDNPCADDHENKIHFHKHIVQMYRLPGSELECIVPSENIEDENGETSTDFPEEIFFFDVPNVHDGLCDCIE